MSYKIVEETTSENFPHCGNNLPSIFHYHENFFNDDELKKIRLYLENINDFISNPKFKDGFSRMQKWYQKDMKYFCPAWKERYKHWESFEMDDTVNFLIDKVQNFLNSNTENKVEINSCLINKYENGDNFISPHRDSEISFGKNPVIAVLSIGHPRTIYFERVDNDETKNFSLKLSDNSIFIMSGSSQSKFLHSIKKEQNCDTRYSLTFREYIL